MMRQIRLAAPSHRAWKRWVLACEKEAATLEVQVTSGIPISFREKLYRRKSIRRHYFFNNDSPFYGKCAYCEGALELIDGDVEHFRPKGTLRDENDERVLIPVEGAEPRPHPGYYWLAYHWGNLLPSCKTCNEIHKGAQFPVEGVHATSAAEIANEKPLLLDPLSDDSEDDPGKHLIIDDNGVIAGKTIRGKTTIRVLGLGREALQRKRRTAFLEMEALLARAFRNESRAHEDLKAIMEGRRPYFLTQKIAFLTRMADKVGL